MLHKWRVNDERYWYYESAEVEIKLQYWYLRTSTRNTRTTINCHLVLNNAMILPVKMSCFETQRRHRAFFYTELNNSNALTVEESWIRMYR